MSWKYTDVEQIKDILTNITESKSNSPAQNTEEFVAASNISKNEILDG